MREWSRGLFKGHHFRAMMLLTRCMVRIDKMRELMEGLIDCLVFLVFITGEVGFCQ